MLVLLGLVLAGTIFFMGAPEQSEAGPVLEEQDLLWVRGYLTNLQAGSVNEMAVDSVRLSKGAIIPILVNEMGVRPPTMGKKLNDRVEKILAEFPALQRQARVQPLRAREPVQAPQPPGRSLRVSAAPSPRSPCRRSRPSVP